MEETTIYKKSKTLLSVIVLGAIGSGLWEICLKDLLFLVGNTFVNSAQFIYSGYIDSLYSEVGKGDLLNIFPTICIFVTIVMMPFFFILHFRRLLKKRDYLIAKSSSNNDKTDNNKFFNYLFSKSYRMYIFIFILFLPVSIYYLHTFIKQSSTYVASRSIARNLEIIKPYTSELQYDILRSDYRLIDNKEKLVYLLKEISKVANKNKVLLPEYDLFGVERNY